ncbi:DeoR/GlpR family DNA-binding transcription regulator [Ethanoligenens harbinense]|uniref:Transcriptional regulator, DeoR family n=1 Tax=Ethanoligenens harbinense (strain DSM 18485 / JCM 12961 / CGMCC 1.5033 / YUAN-3) TaxID=663278 RepID=E6U9E4_ETHHY|nr:DeoR/GlpR family DNA-binding transcription regulator [Ethanoligenens harbinense]ADU26135.1 transcriptional regulator, DeoR family [Ethanoligenens harbinense YUAN-3]
MVQERLEKIKALLSANGMVKANELTRQLGVSIETVRRDLEFLEKCGLLKRVYGGGIANNTRGIERNYSSRECLHMDEKRAIAKKTASLVNDGDALVMDLGTTTLEVAKCLADKNELTILTNSLPVGMEMVKNRSCHVYMLGGELRDGDFSTSGLLATSGLSNFRVDKAIFGASGVSPKNGVTDYHVEEANVRRRMMEIADKVILCTDSSKFAISAFVHVCDVTDIDVIVTDSGVSQQMVDAFDGLAVELSIAQVTDL